MALLKILTPAELQGEFQLDKKVITVGRSAENTIRIEGSTIAPVHASIICDGNAYLLIDHSSMHGTFVNGIRVDRKHLWSGNQIRLGQDAEMLFTTSPGESEQAIDKQVVIATDEADGPISDVQKRITLEEAGFEYEGGVTNRLIEAETQKKYLSAIYQVNQNMTQIFDLTELSQKVLDLIFQIFPVDRAAVILCDSETRSPRPTAFRARSEASEEGLLSISQTIINSVILEKNAVLARDTYFDERFRNVSSIARKHIRSVMCVPLYTKGKVLGALYVDSLDVPGRFRDDDLRLLFAVGGALANSIENALLVDRIKDEERKLTTLGRYLSSVVVEHLFGQQLPSELGGRYASISVLFADIRGFTRLTELVNPADLVSHLNDYFTCMSEVVFEYGGTLGEYIGDEIMAYFGAPVACEDHGTRAMLVALKMMEKMKALKDRWQAEGKPAFDIGIGIGTGSVIAGNIGSTKQMKYTVIGNTVNLARRLCSHAQPGQILISPETYEIAHRPPNVRFLEHASLKGISKPVGVYEVTA